MQLLYSSINGDSSQTDILQRYIDQIQQSYKLYLFNLSTTLQVSDFAKKDQKKRMTKLLPTDADVNFVPKLAINELSSSVKTSEEFHKELDDFGVDVEIEEGTIKSVYAEFVKTTEFKSYQDKALPLKEATYRQFKPNHETTQEFGHKLLKLVLDQDKALLGIIEPNLKNWDADRVAIIDMILLKMAIGELMNFPSIPTKVTLNEYVEIAKLYSTDKSKDFINGILDRLMKKLESDGQINKSGRGLVE